MTSLQQCEYFFELVNDSVMTRTMEGRINFWNRSAEDLYGWRKEEAIGRVSHDLLKTQFPKPLQEIESELVRNGQWEGRLTHITRDGRRVVVESRWALDLKGQSGALFEINTRSDDCALSTEQIRTNRKQAQNLIIEETMASLQQCEYFFELVNDSVMTRTMEGRINFWNRSAEDLYGWRKEEAIGRVSHDLLKTQFPKPLQEIESELVRNGQWEGRLTHITRDGRRVVVESRWTLDLKGQSGALIEVNTRSSDGVWSATAPLDTSSATTEEHAPQASGILTYPNWSQLAGIAALIVGSAWILYLLLGHRFIRLLYNIEFLKFVVMKERDTAPVEVYYRQADELVVLGTFLLVAVFGLGVLIRKPLKVLMAAGSVVFVTFTVFCVFEAFPSLIPKFHLHTIALYYGYKSAYIYDDELIYREKPFTHSLSRDFRGSHYSPDYGIDVPPVGGEYSLDENGFRNAPGKRSADIVVLGDSYVVFGDNEADTFVSRMEKKLPGVTAVNLGVSGWGPFQYLAALKRYGLNYKPRYVLFGFYEGNDIYDVGSYLNWKQKQVDKHASLVYRIGQMSFIQRYWEIVTEIGASIREILNWLIQLALDKMAESKEARKKGIHPDLAALKLGNEEYKILFIDRLNPMTTAEMLRSKEWQVLREILRELSEVCAQNKIIPIVMYIPTTVHVYGPYSTRSSGENWLKARDEQIGVRKNTEKTLQYLARELELDFLSLTPVFEAKAQQGQLLYMQLDSHWNPDGREVAAEFVAQALGPKLKHSVALEQKNSRAGQAN